MREKDRENGERERERERVRERERIEKGERWWQSTFLITHTYYRSS